MERGAKQREEIFEPFGSATSKHTPSVRKAVTKRNRRVSLRDESCACGAKCFLRPSVTLRGNFPSEGCTFYRVSYFPEPSRS